MSSNALTVGIEEEYLLLDPATGAPVPAADRVRGEAAALPALGDDDVELELLQVQVEVATPVCTSLTKAGGHLLRLRSEVSRAAKRTVHFGRWPVSGPPPLFTDPADYKHRVRAVLDTGALRAAVWQAARDELSGRLLDPITEQSRPAPDEVSRLYEYVRPALTELGDDAEASALLEQRAQCGPGARRQREAYDRNGLDGVPGLLVEDF